MLATERDPGGELVNINLDTLERNLLQLAELDPDVRTFRIEAAGFPDGPDYEALILAEDEDP